MVRAQPRFYAITDGAERGLELEAIAGPHLPKRIVVSECSVDHPRAMIEVLPCGQPRLFEHRVYRSRAGAGMLEGIFARAGIFPWLCGEGLYSEGLRGEQSYLIPFDSLAARETAWRRVAADQEWARVRSDSSVTEIGIYCGRIFEMSL